MRNSTQLEVNLDLLSENFLKIKKISPKVNMLPMVKADAYGHGLLPISSFLIQELKVNQLGVASLGEALEIIKHLDVINYEVIVFSDNELFDSDLKRRYLELPIIPVIHKVSDLEIFLRNDEFEQIPFYLKVNTGMNRLGIDFDDLEKLIPLLKKRGRVDHLMTHFSSSYYLLREGDKTHRQYAEFIKIKNYLKAHSIEVLNTSVSNSGAIEQHFGLEESHIRPGLMLYGPYSVEPRIWDGHQISKLQTKVLKTFKIKKGTPVGYGVHVAGDDLFMIILPVGYGDGLLTFMSGIEISINGFVGRVFGRVNMDMIFISFHPSVENKIKENQIVEIWGHDNRALTKMAQQMKTHSYQMMTALSSRIPKVYKVK